MSTFVSTYFNSALFADVRRKTIYEYHKLDMINSTAEHISNNTAIFLKAKTSMLLHLNNILTFCLIIGMLACVSLKSCTECVSSTDTGFDCGWCLALGRCSDGFDRNRQEWISNQCDQPQNNINKNNKTSLCPAPTTPPISTTG